ncbi:MAG: glycine cleavage system protein GcvH [Deltaproteobacteria bacterium]|nr:glycine cleavage system protein GcvH [Deltaproteobacteria bacterium]
MSKVNPTDRKYSKDHEWILDHGDGIATLGITDHAQELLTDIVYVELPEIGKKVTSGDAIAAVESVKSVSDIFSPISGEVIDVNRKLEASPNLINADAFGEGWIVKLNMDDAAAGSALMNADEYESMIVADRQ